MKRKHHLAVGQKFGLLTVKEKAKVGWVCTCACGKDILVRAAYHLVHGNKRQCGCSPKRHAFCPGQQFGRLTVIEDKRDNNGCVKCACSCGNTKAVKATHLIQGRIQSCGCLGDEIRRALHKENKLPPRVAAARSLLCRYKNRAKKRGLTFDLTDDEFYTLTSSCCFYCGVHPKQSNGFSRKDRYPYNGIDRIDNKHGYTRSNSVPCCGICNRAKNKLPLKPFVEWINRLHTNRAKMFKDLQTITVG